MRRALVAFAAALALIVGAATPADANVVAIGTRPVVYAGPFHGWPAWCALIGWSIEMNAAGQVSAGIVIGSTTDGIGGNGACNFTPTVALATMDARLDILQWGQPLGFVVTNAGPQPAHYRSGYKVIGQLASSWYEVRVTAVWRDEGRTVAYASDPVYVPLVRG